MRATDVDSKEIDEWAKGRIAKHRLPLPKRPKGSSPEFDFPDDPSKLSNAELGQQMLRFASFFGYAQRRFGIVEARYVLVDAEYTTKVNVAGIQIRESEALGKRPSAEVVEAAVLRDNKELAPLYRRRLQLLTLRVRLESLIKIYERLYAALSRELSRRELESHIQ